MKRYYFIPVLALVVALLSSFMRQEAPQETQSPRLSSLAAPRSEASASSGEIAATVMASPEAESARGVDEDRSGIGALVESAEAQLLATRSRNDLVKEVAEAPSKIPEDLREKVQGLPPAAQYLIYLATLMPDREVQPRLKVP